MAGFTFTATPATLVAYGRDGYNKGDDDDNKNGFRNFGRDGYNKSGDDDDKNGLRNFGRDGYN